MPRAKRVKRSSPTSVIPSSSPSSVKDNVPIPEDIINQNQAELQDNDETTDQSNDTQAKQPSTSPQSASKGPSYIPGGGGYNALKTFNGQVYTGMAVGGSHTWNYDAGLWTETKEEPDLWKIDFETTKRRAKNAPEGSGAPIGIEYHWLVVAHQYVKKVDANTYSTHLAGSKYKLAHKPAGASAWSVSTVKGQRDRELALLDDARRRVQGLPPVLAGEKVKVHQREKGQRKLDGLFSKAGGGAVAAGSKRKLHVEGDDDKENVDLVEAD